MKISTANMTAATARRLKTQLTSLKSVTWDRPHILSSVLTTLSSTAMTDEQARKVVNSIKNDYWNSYSNAPSLVDSVLTKE
jgi:ABC-type uncharacterized transport system YnjBCD permease subunit